MAPAVSVCVPVYNGAAYLEATLRSLLAQDHRDFEVVVLDNASTDGTAEILARLDDPRVRVERNPTTLPLPENWRRACELATGTYLKVVCADDLVAPTCLRAQAELLDGHPEVSLVACRRDVIDPQGSTIARARGLRGLLGRHDGREVAAQTALLGINPIGESAAVMFRRHDYERLGGWDGQLVYPMDLDLWLRLLTVGDLYGQGESLAAYRITTTSLTSALSAAQYDEQRRFLSRMAGEKRWRLPALLRHVARVTGPVALWTWSLRHKEVAVRQALRSRRGR